MRDSDAMSPRASSFAPASAVCRASALGEVGDSVAMRHWAARKCGDQAAGNLKTAFIGSARTGWVKPFGGRRTDAIRLDFGL